MQQIVYFGELILAPDRLVGSVRLHNIDDETNSCDIGVCVFDRSIWGKEHQRRLGEFAIGGECLELQTVVSVSSQKILVLGKHKSGFVSPAGIENQIRANRILNASVHVVARLPLNVSCQVALRCPKSIRLALSTFLAFTLWRRCRDLQVLKGYRAIKAACQLHKLQNSPTPGKLRVVNHSRWFLS